MQIFCERIVTNNPKYFNFTILSRHIKEARRETWKKSIQNCNFITPYSLKLRTVTPGTHRELFVRLHLNGGSALMPELVAHVEYNSVSLGREWDQKSKRKQTEMREVGEHIFNFHSTGMKG
jgi:hypothetical protein